jgi:hypothetical protein
MMQRPRQKDTIFGFFWHDEFEIDTMDTPAEVRAKLAHLVGEVPVFDLLNALKKVVMYSPPSKIRPFVGTITDEAFQFRLYPTQRRTEKINLYGTIHASGTGATVMVKIKMNPVRALLMSDTNMILLFLLAFVLLPPILGGSEIHLSYYILPALLVFLIYLITTMGFWNAATIAKNAIVKALR